MKAELFTTMLELATGVCVDVAEAVEELAALQVEARRRLHAHGLELAAAGPGRRPCSGSSRSRRSSRCGGLPSTPARRRSGSTARGCRPRRRVEPGGVHEAARGRAPVASGRPAPWPTSRHTRTAPRRASPRPAPSCCSCCRGRARRLPSTLTRSSWPSPSWSVSWSSPTTSCVSGGTCGRTRGSEPWRSAQPDQPTRVADTGRARRALPCTSWSPPIPPRGARRPRRFRPEPLGRRPLRCAGRPDPSGDPRADDAAGASRRPGRPRPGGRAARDRAPRRPPRSARAPGQPSRTISSDGPRLGDDAGDRHPRRAPLRLGGALGKLDGIESANANLVGEPTPGTTSASVARRSSPRSTSPGSTSSPTDSRAGIGAGAGRWGLVSDGWQRPRLTATAWRLRPVTASGSRGSARLADQVYRVARRLVRSREEAKDLVQETYARAFRSWRSYSPGRISGPGSCGS